MTSDKNCNFEIGWILFRTVALRLGFLIVGYTTTCLKQEGTEPLARLLFRMSEIVGPMVLNTSFNRHVGIMSREQVVGLLLDTMSLI